MNSLEPMAKSAPPMTLRCHTEDVMQAVDALINALRYPLAEVTPISFADMMRVAAFFHDLGKAASGFQEVVTYHGSGTRPRWNYRHEALSAAVLLASGLETIYGTQLVGAVMTHHKTLDHEKLSVCTGRGLPRSQFEKASLREWNGKIAELNHWWGWVREYVAAAQAQGWIPTLPQSLPNVPSHLPNLYQANEKLEAVLDKMQGLSEASIPWILARGLLMGGDHLASAGLGVPLTHLAPSGIEPAVGFQMRVQATQGSALLEAPTGSGKTEAAIYWALSNRQGGERIFYILPYQASINKMEERLGTLFGRENVGMIHHRASLQEFSRHFDADTDNYNTASTKAKERIDQTKQFYRPIKVMTPYQLLKLMFGCRFFEIGLTELLGGLIIFDEIHAYDPHVAALIEVCIDRLRAFKVRFLFMTATFPSFLKERLKDRLNNPPLLTVERDHKRDIRLLTTARHTLHLRHQTLEDCTDAIVADAAQGKVLVVCNRVAQAQAMYEMLADQVPSIALLHSRFISNDRTKKENDLAGFPDATDAKLRQVPKANVLIATQVVEVSLNLSFDTIYTEAAPVDALLQRFGRVNRMNQHGKPVPVYVATEFDDERVKFIYSLDRIIATLTNAPDGEDLLPSVENKWVQNTYQNGYDVEEQRKYDAAYVAFTATVNNLRPFYTGNDDDFYAMFDNYNVVPIRFEHLYRNAIEEKRYFQAAGYVASLSQPTYLQMKQYAEYDTESHVYYLNRRYDAELGLLNEAETDTSYRQEAFDRQCL